MEEVKQHCCHNSVRPCLTPVYTRKTANSSPPIKTLSSGILNREEWFFALCKGNIFLGVHSWRKLQVKLSLSLGCHLMGIQFLSVALFKKDCGSKHLFSVIWMVQCLTLSYYLSLLYCAPTTHCFSVEPASLASPQRDYYSVTICPQLSPVVDVHKDPALCMLCWHNKSPGLLRFLAV